MACITLAGLVRRRECAGCCLVDAEDVEGVGDCEMCRGLDERFLRLGVDNLGVGAVWEK